MAKVKKKVVEEKLEAWARLQGKIRKAEAARNKDLKPLLEAHNEKTAPLLQKFETAVSPLREKANTLEKEITVLVEADRDEKGNPKPILINSQAATVSVEKKEGARVIQVKDFFDYVKDKNAQFWSCFSVVIKEAEKVVGKTKIDDLSDKKTAYVTTIKLN